MPKRSFAKDENLRFEIAKKIFTEIGKRYTNREYTDDEIKEVCNNKENLKLQERASELIARDKERAKIVDSITSKYGFDVHTSAGRLSTYLMELPSPNATKIEKDAIDKKNEEIVLDLCNPKKIGKYVNNLINDAFNFDYSKMFPKDINEAMDIYEAHSKEMNELFIINSIIDMSGCRIEPAVRDQIAKFTSLMEEAEYPKNMVYMAGSNMPFILPKDFDITKVSSDEIQSVMSEILKDYKDVEGFNFESSISLDKNLEQTTKDFYNMEMEKENHKLLGEVIAQDMKDNHLTNGKDLLVNFGTEGGTYKDKIDSLKVAKDELKKLEEVKEENLSFEENAMFCGKLGIDFVENASVEDLKRLALKRIESVKTKDLCNLKENSEELKAELAEKVKESVVGLKKTNPIFYQAKPAHDAYVEFMQKPDRYKKFFTESDALSNKDCTIEDSKDLLKLYAYGKMKQETRGFFRRIFRHGACVREDNAVRNVEEKLESLGIDQELRDAYKDLMESKNINFDRICSISKNGPKFYTEKEFRQKEFFDAREMVEKFEENRKSVEIPTKEIEPDKVEQQIEIDESQKIMENGKDVPNQKEME